MAKELYTRMGKEVLFKDLHFADAVNEAAADLITGQMQKLVDQTQSHDESQDQIIKRLREENQIFRVGLVAADAKIKTVAEELRTHWDDMKTLWGNDSGEAGSAFAALKIFLEGTKL